MLHHLVDELLYCYGQSIHGILTGLIGNLHILALSTKNTKVRLAGFGDYALEVEIRANLDTTDLTEFRAIREDIFLHTMKIVKETGTGFAFPSRTVIMPVTSGASRRPRHRFGPGVPPTELPFPNFTADYRKKLRNTLDYPPEGSPHSGE